MRKRSALGDDAAWVFLPRVKKMMPLGCSACSTCNSGAYQNGIQVDKISKLFINSSIAKSCSFVTDATDAKQRALQVRLSNYYTGLIETSLPE